MARHHYHVIESDYGDPLYPLRTLADVRKGIQWVLKDYRSDKDFQIVGNGSGLWYKITDLTGMSSKDTISFLTFDECTDDDCGV